MRRTLDVLLTSQIADLRSAARFAALPQTRQQYQGLLDDTLRVTDDPETKRLLETVDCVALLGSR